MTPIATKDYLEQDQPIRGQNYTCLSFVSPEDIIAKKDAFFLKEFITGFSSEVKTVFESLSERFRDDATVIDMLTGVKNAHDYLFDASKIQAEMEHFMTVNRDRLEREYHEANDFQTSVRGIKVRGTYETLNEAKARAQAIQKFDKKFHIYVAEVGCWCPWNPTAGSIDNQEYTETQLNTLVKGHSENMADAQAAFDDGRVR